MLVSLLVLASPALAQSDLKRVEAETQAIQDSVAGSRAQLEALQARLTSGDPTTLTVALSPIAAGYSVQWVEYFVDGEPVRASEDGALTVEVRSGGTVTARMEVRGAPDRFLKSYSFRMQRSFAVGTLGGERELKLVMSAKPGSRPSLDFEIFAEGR